MTDRHDRLRVLFLCTGNSARSQMAEALLRQLSKGRIEALSADTKSQSQVHPLRGDYVITVCNRAAELCPVFPGDPERIHWSFEDPAAVEDENARRRAFAWVANGLAGRLRVWMSLPTVQPRVESAERSSASGAAQQGT